MSRHELTDMGQRFARCSCGHSSSISAVEFVERGYWSSRDLLLDRHNAHVEAMKDQGR